MVNYNIITKASLILAFIFQFCNAQDNPRNDFSNFEGFKKVGYHLSGVLYKKADIDKKYGDYKLINYPIVSGRIGFDYAFNHQKNWSFRTGLYLDLIPFYNVEFEFKPEDLDFIDWDLEGSLHWNKKQTNKFVFTIPFLIEGKLQMGKKIFFSAMGGLDFTILNSGQFDFVVSYGNNLNEGREVFAMYGETSGFFIYPSLRLGPGLYFVTKKALYQLQLTYKKSLVPYFKGEYQFGNLDVSEPTRGDYKLSGDFIGLGLTMFLKKKKKNQ